MIRAWILALILTLLLTLAPGGAALAQGFIIPVPPRPPEPLPPNPVIRYHHVDVEIDGQVARTTVDQVFINSFHRDIEGTYIFPLPQGAAISDFSMYVNGRELRGEILGRDEARRIYEEIVRRRRDPGLLEYFKDGMFRASVYPIPAHGETKIRLRYSEVMKLAGGVCGYRYALGTERFSRDPIEGVRVSVRIDSKRPLKSIYSPSHAVRIERESDYHARVTYVEENARPSTDFLLYYTVSDDDIGFDLLSFKDDSGQGYFLAMASPRIEIPEGSVSRKDIVFILDTSGSMKGKKVEQARGALRFCLNSLHDGDRFNVIDFDDDLRRFSPGLVSAGPRTISDALAFIDRCEAGGGTNINDALLEGLDEMRESRKASFVIFLTDGLPTVGETDIGMILSNAKRANESNARIFVFGVGYDVNTRLLDLLAEESHAASDYVSPAEDIEVKVSDFYAKVSSPVLTGVELSFEGLDAYDIYPRRIPDIFKGSQLIVLGKYRGRAQGRAILSGTSGAGRRTFSYEVNSASDDDNAFIPRLWATRRIGYLVDQLRLHGEDRELVNEIVYLSKRYGIITEYTSFLVDVGFEVTQRDLVPMAEKKLEAAMSMLSGAEAVNRAKSSRVIANACVAPRSYTDSEGTKREVTNVVQVGARTFFNRNGTWVDSEYDGSAEPIRVKAFSEAYFELLRRVPEIGRYLALGDEVIFIMKGKAVRVGAEGAEILPETELKSLAGR
jgi:Ca-activated chloride channel family protein